MRDLMLLLAARIFWTALYPAWDAVARLEEQAVPSRGRVVGRLLSRAWASLPPAYVRSRAELTEHREYVAEFERQIDLLDALDACRQTEWDLQLEIDNLRDGIEWVTHEAELAAHDLREEREAAAREAALWA